MIYQIAWMTGIAAGLATILAVYNARWPAARLGLLTVGCVGVAMLSRSWE
jgi:hypothetical protein